MKHCVSLACISVLLYQSAQGGQLFAPQADDDVQDDLSIYCGNDIMEFCPTATTDYEEWTCLYANESQLSPECQQYLTGTVEGGCNSDAQNLCGQYESVDDIYDCLVEHSDELSATCFRNIQNYSDELTEEQKRADRATLMVTNLSLIILMIPSILAFFAFRKMLDMKKLQQHIRQQGANVWKDSSTVPIVRYANGTPLNDEIDPRRGWCISFHNLSYWAYKPTSWMDIVTSYKKERKPILHNVSIAFMCPLTLFCGDKFLGFCALDLGKNRVTKGDSDHGAIWLRKDHAIEAVGRPNVLWRVPWPASHQSRHPIPLGL